MIPRPRPNAFALALALSLFALSPLGCAAGGGAASQPAVVFPSRDEVASLPSRPPRAEAFATSDVPADAWTFEAPAADDGAPYEDASPWGALLRERVAAHAKTVTLSPALRCAATEMARFAVAQKGLPAEPLRRFTIARCGGTTPDAAPVAWWVDAPSAVPDEALIARARDPLSKALERNLVSGQPVVVGLGVARDAHRAAVVALVGLDEARLEPGSRRADASRRVRLRGQARGDYAHIDAWINRGPFGVARCDAAAAAPPRFDFTCAMADGDESAWIEVLGQKRGAILQHPIADVLAASVDPSALKYARRPYAAPTPVANGDAFAAAVVDGVNRARAAGKLAPLAVAREQSAENTRLAGTLIDASVSHDDATADRAAIGLLAGWHVAGPIRNGAFFLDVVAPTRDASDWIASALERPLGRVTLLDPDVRRIAVGPAIPDGVPGLGAAITTYALFESEDHAAEEARFFARLAEARAERGIAAPVRVQDVPAPRAEAASVLHGTKPVGSALDDMLEDTVARTGGAARGYVLETNDVDHVAIPEELLGAGPMRVAIAVTHHKAPGAAWAQYVIFLVILGPPPVET
jgi:hypothetical protein